MAKKKKTQEQPGLKIDKVPAKGLDRSKMKKPVVVEKSGQPQIKDNLTDSPAAKLKDLPPIEKVKVSTDAPDNSPKVKPLPDAKAEIKTEAGVKTPSDFDPAAH